jgi:hypothetical protein
MNGRRQKMGQGRGPRPEVGSIDPVGAEATERFWLAIQSGRASVGMGVGVDGRRGRGQAQATKETGTGAGAGHQEDGDEGWRRPPRRRGDQQRLSKNDGGGESESIREKIGSESSTSCACGREKKPTL